MSSIDSKLPPLRLDPVSYESSAASRFCIAMAGGANRAARCRTWRFTINSFAAIRAMTRKRI